MNKTRQNKSETTIKSLTLYAAVGAGLGLLSTLLILFGVSALLVTGSVPASLKDALILAAILMGTTVGGFYCAGRRGGGVVTAGLISSLAYVVLLLVGILMFKKGDTETSLLLRQMVASVAGGCFGGVLRLHKKTKKSRLRK